MNPSTAKILDRALQLVVARQQWFTAEDIASTCDFEVPIDEVTAWLSSSEPNPALVRYSAPDLSQIDAYTTEGFLARWWIERAIRWLESGVETLTARELGDSMAATFGIGTWEVPSDTLLGAGIELHATARTIDDQRYAMPWSIIAGAIPRMAEYLRATLRLTDPRTAFDPDSIAARWAGLFAELDWRSMRVLALRFGLSDSTERTLEDIGDELDLTRERIRQIERTALIWLRRRGRHSLSGLAATSLLAAGSTPLVLDDQDLPPQLRLVAALYGAEPSGVIKLLGIRILHRACWISDFESALMAEENMNHIFETRLDDGASLTLPPSVHDILATIPLAEANFLSEQALKLLNSQFDSIRRKEQVYRALKHLGTASHYSAVAEICNKVWIKRPLSGQYTINNLSACEKDPNYDVVWIGRKGMYGLASQGYARPDKDLFETAAEIVRTEFAKTGCPVPFNTVWAKLHEHRQEPHKPSLVMALGINDGVDVLEDGNYAPSGLNPASQPDLTAPRKFDFSGTF